MKKIRELEKNPKFHNIISVLMIIASAFLQSFILEAFMEPCDLISGGFTGIALFLHKIFASLGINFSVSAGILLLNLPAALFCWKHISRRFVLLSTLQFVLVSLFLETMHVEPLMQDQTLNILFGGLAYGFSIALALKAGGSTGGTDFIAQYVSNKLHRSIFDDVFYFNCAMYVLYGFMYGWIHAGYSILFQFLSTKAISTIYQRYSQVTIEITTKDPDAVTDAFLTVCAHGLSIFEATGGYSGQKYYICKSVVSTYEAPEVIANIRTVEPDCLVNTYKTQSFYGNFHQQPLE